MGGATCVPAPKGSMHQSEERPAPSSGRKPGSPIATRLVWLIALLIISGVMGVVGAVEINKGATLHKLNFLHVKYNQVFSDNIARFEQGAAGTDILRRDVMAIREQPAACLAVAGFFEAQVMRLLNTDRAIDLCSEDVALADRTLRHLQTFDIRPQARAQLATTLNQAHAQFAQNSAQFEPLVDRTVGFVSAFVLAMLATITVVATAIGTFLTRTIARDYEQLAIAKEQRRETDETFQALFDTIETGTIATDQQGIIQIYNPAAERLFGYSAQEALGQNVSMLMPEPDRGRHDGYLKAYLETGNAKIIGIGREVQGRNKSGRRFPLHLQVGELMVRGQPWFVGSAADLSKLKAVESQLRQAQKMEAVGQLTGGVAHDFNNLLAVIQGNLSLLEEDLAAGPEHVADDPMPLVEGALQATRRGADLTRRLLALSRDQNLQPRVVSFDTIIGDFESLLRRTLGETIELRIVSRPTQWMVNIDIAQLQNAVLNLALNARDAMPAGGSLTIETDAVGREEDAAQARPGAPRGPHARLTVRDDGDGMTPEIREKVFEPFFTTKEVGKGSGLGLSMVYGFVKQSGGQIILDSEPDVGTSFEIYLPRCIDAAPDPDSHAETGPVQGGREKILVVEDQEQVREVVVRMLTRLGYRVVAAHDGPSALLALADHPVVDLLLTDFVLPGGMNGSDVSSAAKSSHPGIKILVMSGYRGGTAAADGPSSGEVEFIAKPFSEAELATKVRAVIDAEI